MNITHWNTILNILVWIVTLFGVAITFWGARTTKKVSLLSKRVRVYSLLQALVSTLEQSLIDCNETKAEDLATMAGSWLDLLKKEHSIQELLGGNYGEDTTSILLSALKNRIDPCIREANFIFDKRKVSQGVAAMMEQLVFWGQAHANVGTRIDPLTDNVRSSVNAALDKGRQSLKSMEKEMTL